jgi:uncharacterized protein
MNSNNFELITEVSINNLEFCSKLGYACLPSGPIWEPSEPSTPKREEKPEKKEPEKEEPEKPERSPWNPTRWFPFFPKQEKIENYVNFRNNALNLFLSGDGISTFYKILPNLIFIDIDDTYKVVINSSDKAKISVLNQEAYKLLMTFQEARNINLADEDEKHNIINLINAKLLTQVADHSSNTIISSKSLVVWLHITNACPLRCKYCYVVKSNEHMSDEVGQAAIETIFSEASKHDFTKVQIKYAGGEPSQNLDVVEVLHQLAVEKAQQQGLELDEVILSSGVMTKQARQKMVKMGIRTVISIDAVGEEHNLQRPSLSGHPTVQTSQECLLDLKNAGLEVFVSVTVTRQSAATLIQLINFLLEINVPFTLNFARDNEQFHEKESLLPQNDQLVKTMKEVVAYFAKNPPKSSLLGSLLDRVNFFEPHLHTCGAGKNYLVIDHKGQISKCQQTMLLPITSIFEADPLIKIISSSLGIENPSVDSKKSCNSCEYRYWCTGGCPALTTQIYGEADVQSPFCDVYKALIPEVIRLEGKRLLKYGQI